MWLNNGTELRILSDLLVVGISEQCTRNHEVSMQALYLLQNCVVYINTLMLQQLLA